MGSLFAAGCADRGPAGSPGSTDTDQTPDTGPETTTFPDDCEAVSRETVDPYRDDVNPKELPSRPDEFTETSVENFVSSYEEAYIHNQLLDTDTAEVGVWTTTESVEVAGDGWEVVLRTGWYRNSGPTATGTASSTTVHGDGPEELAAYYLNESRMLRVKGEYETVPDPREEGVTVECW